MKTFPPFLTSQLSQKIAFPKLFLGLALIVVTGLCLAAVLVGFQWKSSPHSFSRIGKMVFLIEKILPTSLENLYRDVIVSHNRIAVWNGDIEQRLVWGYVDRHSIKPGEGFNLMLSTDPIDPTVYGHVEIFRIGHYGQEDRTKIWESDSIKVRNERVPASASVFGLNWPITLKEIPTSSWRSGYYTIDFVEESGKRDGNITYIVVTPPQQGGDILVKLSTNTYQAYNLWGGANLYQSLTLKKQNDMVSFDRPTLSEFFEWEYYYIVWLEELAQKLNLTVDYVTDFDIHQNAGYTQNYTLFISVGHDEYWSKEEFSHIYDRIFLYGKNTLFLGANTAYRQIRYMDANSPSPESGSGRQMICFKDNDDPIIFKSGQDPLLDAAIKFRDKNRRSEIMLKGNGYQSWFPLHSHKGYPYFVQVNPENSPFFKGTSYNLNSKLESLIGNEWDNTDPSPNKNRFWEQGISKIPYLPEGKIQVLFRGYPFNHRGEPGIAEAVYFESDAGAKVFSSGTIQWPWGLTKPGYEQEDFRTFNKNLVEVFTQEEKPSPTQFPAQIPPQGSGHQKHQSIDNLAANN